VTVVQSDLFFAVLAEDASHWRVSWRGISGRAPLRSLPGAWSRQDVEEFLMHYAHGFEDGFREGEAAGRRKLQGQLRALLGAEAAVRPQTA
jgi:hypothetical protein